MEVNNGDQRNISQSDVEDASRQSGKNIKGFRPEGQVDAVNQVRTEEARKEQAEAKKRDPTLAASLHGNQPHPGARVDKELQDEDEATVKKMDERKNKN